MIAKAIIAWAARRAPDFQIGGAADPYMNRWYVIPRNRVFNIYLHQFMRSDEDWALHDHPWLSLSWMLAGEMFELTKNDCERLSAGRWRFRGSRLAHRLVVDPDLSGKVWTLFITGPRIRQWGFHCPGGRWVHWQDFTAGEKGELVGKGCGE